MRVTQSMLSGNMLRNLNTSYGKMSKLQDQMNSGSKINRPSDDPVIAVKGMGYRVDIDKIEQYKRNISDAHTWLDTTDTSLGQVGDALHRVRELTVQAANDTNTPEERQKISTEIKQLKGQLRDLANTKVGENYIFSGTHTDQPLYTDEVSGINEKITTGVDGDFKINVFDGVSLKINTNPSELFSQIDGFLGELGMLLDDPATTNDELNDALGKTMDSSQVDEDGEVVVIAGLDALLEQTLTVRAEVGARQNRVEMMENRLDTQFVNVTKQMSQNEDTDYAAAITEMATHESIHQAALSVGAKIIQSTLVDFMR
ncbi:MAG: flagellar hook-associated protein FlgL [Solibacillus sp.]